MAKKTNKKKNSIKKEKRTKPTKDKTQKKLKRKVINFVSGNKNKLRELNEILSENFKDIIVKQLDIDLPELQGIPEDIVRGKLKLAIEKSKGLEGPVLVEDTSLCFNAYGGLPGPYINIIY